MKTGLHSFDLALRKRTRSLAIAATAVALALTTVVGSASAAVNVQPATDTTSVPILALPGYQVSLFAQGTSSYSHPDAIIDDGSHIFIDYQNVTAKDGSDGKSSTIVEYTTDGQVVQTFSISGHSDGLRENPADPLLWATSNEDGNPVLHTINPDTGAIVAYQFASSPHGGGYDDLMFLGGQVYVAASNPTVDAAGVNVYPAVDRMWLAGNTVNLSPVLMGNDSATDLTTNSTVTLNEVDPDSMTVDPSGNLVLINQAGNEIVWLHNPCTAQQSVSRIPVGSQLDDTVWATAAQGQLFVVDGAQNATYIIRSTFTPGTVYTELPSDSGVTSLVGTVDLKTGFISPIAIGFGNPTGMLFVPDNAPAVAASAPVTCVQKTPVTSELGATNSGTLAGATGGAFADYQVSNPSGSAMKLTLSYSPFNTVGAHGIGLNVYQGGSLLASATAQGKGSGDSIDNGSPSVTVTPSASAGPVLIQLFNYDNGQQISYTITKA